jgi:hypothetical protein
MLLSVSGKQNGLDVDLEVAVDASRPGDAGVPHGEELLAFATAANRRSDDLPAVRERLRVAVGDEGMIEAAATVAIFNGLVRVADGTGIQLDPSMMTSTVDTRDKLGIGNYGGAANSIGAPTEPRRRSTEPVRSFFD